jgi:hypothetical protein
MGVYTAIAEIGLSVEKLLNRRFAAAFAADPKPSTASLRPGWSRSKTSTGSSAGAWDFTVGTQIVLGSER